MTKLDLGNPNNEKIENLNLVALRKYACPKVNGEKEWYLKCVDCGSCSVGKRVQDILDEETGPIKTQIEKFNMRLSKTRDAVFAEAVKHPHPHKWLVEEGRYSSIESAANAFRDWLKETNLVSEEQKAKIRNEKSRRGGAVAGANRTQEARNRLERIFSGARTAKEKQIAVLTEAQPEDTCKSIYNRLLRWAHLYPDLEKKYRFMDDCRLFGTRAILTKTAKEMLEELGDEEPSDEVSIEDFLAEHEPATDIFEEAKPVDPEADMVDNTLTKQLVTENSRQLVLQEAFGLKKQELRKRITYIRGEIAKLYSEEAKLTSQMKTLDDTAELFGMKAVRED